MDADVLHVHELFSMKGQIALVTGGSRGLGLEIAAGLGEAGAAVVITGRRDTWLKDAAKQLHDRGIDCLALTCDVADPAQVESTVASAIERFGRIHVLVNNAGISWGAPAETLALDKWRQVFETNATGCLLMSRAVGRNMMAHHGGTIVNIASIAALVGTPPEILDSVAYSASKGALVSLTRDLAVKWARHHIRVNAIAPGFFRTRMTTAVLDRSEAAIAELTPLGRIGRPGELKGAAVFLASAASSYMTGQVLVVDGGQTAW